MLDWQFTNYCPPAIDLLYNIFTSTDKQFRKQHYVELIQTYHSSLINTIQKLGSDPNLFTYADLQTQLREMGEITLFLAPMLILVKICNPKDIKPMDEYAASIESGEEIDLINELDEETQAEFIRLMNDLLDDLVSLEYIHLE